MNFKVTIGTENNKIIKVFKRFSLIIFIPCFSFWIFMMDMKASCTFIISAENTFIFKHAKNEIPSSFSVSAFSQFKWLCTIFSSYFLSIFQSIVMIFYSPSLIQSSYSLFIMNWSALFATNISTRCWQKFCFAVCAGNDIFWSKVFCTIKHEELYHKTLGTWKAFGTIS